MIRLTMRDMSLSRKFAVLSLIIIALTHHGPGDSPVVFPP